MSSNEDKPQEESSSEPEAAEPAAKRADASAPIPRSVSTKSVALALGGLILVLYVGARIGPAVGAGFDKLWSTLAGSDNAESGAATHYYTCGMHPWVIEPKPGNCPICGMQLVPLDPAKFSGQVTIDPVVSQNIGVRVQKVSEGSESGSIRTVGTITYDETLLGDVNLKVAGWIEKLDVDYLGAPVKRGQALFELYSPDLYAAQEEYLLAYRASERASSLDAKSAAHFASDLLEPARTKLALYDIGAKQIAALEARDKPFKTMTITSPQSGVVIEKQAFEGMKVSPGMTAFRIADLSRVWVMATLYEYQSRQIEVGQKASMTLTYLPGQTLEGKVVYVYPFVDQTTRQLKVRLEVPNPDLKLKPGMFATVVFEGTKTDKRVLVPRSAVIDTGERQVAFVAEGEGRFEPRKVHMGAETEDGKVDILDGLKPGELVVVNGQFLIDSEARMREALARMMKGTSVGQALAPAAPAAASSTLALPEPANTTLAAALDGYLAIGAALARDTTTDIGVSARKVAEALDALMATPIEGQPDFWKQHAAAAAAKQNALDLSAPANLAQARQTFAALSSALSELLHATGVPKGYAQKLQDTHCPMYPAGSKQGSVWIQPEGALHNPYFGKAMPSCSDWQRPLEAAP